jgi:hypothetical protein
MPPNLSWTRSLGRRPQKVPRGTITEVVVKSPAGPPGRCKCRRRWMYNFGRLGVRTQIVNPLCGGRVAASAWGRNPALTRLIHRPTDRRLPEHRHVASGCDPQSGPFSKSGVFVT